MSRPLSMIANRARMVAMAAVAALALSACNQTDEVARKANKPLTPEMLSLLAKKDMAPSSPILVRIFKQESELEVWKVRNDGDYALLKTYPICRWSGELGPKVKMGDRQAPEGFYNITPGQMNPNSNYYLSFNLGFPNNFDRAYGRTGEFLMVHGDCSSAGCYAMTDEQVSEIFSLARESFAGGQRSFQVQALPFRMTPKNLAKHRSNPNMPFWKNLKEGTDIFEVAKREPKVSVCNRRYLFDAQAEGGQGFDPSGACPRYTVPADVAGPVAAKARADEAQVAALSSSTPVAPSKTGRDGGMHPIFLAKFKKNKGSEFAFAEQLPGTVPDTTRPPVFDDEPEIADSQPSAEATVALASRPGAPAAPTQAASPEPPRLSVASAPGTPAAGGAEAAPLPPSRPTATQGEAAPKAAARPATPVARPSAPVIASTGAMPGNTAGAKHAPQPSTPKPAAKPADAKSTQQGASGQVSGQVTAKPKPEAQKKPNGEKQAEVTGTLRSPNADLVYSPALSTVMTGQPVGSSATFSR